ncbi:hypothetical protein CK203_015764 [Vitis vinifera]|uniref:Uncharacterized protein n=1 Tax=Vitis vinifera TaxID=29760 RepID=A0A438JRS2_VITVI|nr:hypothetical protein CK203_015764 [Vitis vinifera]
MLGLKICSFISFSLSPIINSVEQNIESQLKTRHPELVEWFRMVELPRIAGFFIPLLKKWSMEYAGSGVARIIPAISCCVAVGKLGSGHISCPLFIPSIEDALIELMNWSHSLVSVDKLHQLATEAGFEQEFLYNFGTKILSNQKSEDVEFWIGLAQKKLAKAIRRESVFSGLQTFQDKVQESNCLATLGIFAFLGRKTRLFLFGMGIKDLDEQVKDFLSYFECGSLFIYHKFSSLSVYQLFMEVVADEIGWLDFYAAFPFGFNQERRRSKQRAIQQFNSAALKCRLVGILASKSLLTSCLEDYWAAYDRSGYDNADFSSSQLQKIAERNALHQTQSTGTKDTTSSSLTLDAQQKVTDLMARRYPEKIPHSGNKLSKASCKVGTETRTLVEAGRTTESEALHQNLLKKSSMKLISTSSDIWMGTQLLFIDIMASLELLLKQMRGRRVTERERKKLKQTVADIASLILVTILMLLPVSVVGHASILAAIKKYMPSLVILDCTLSCTMNGHKSVVSALAVFDGVLYSGSWDGTIRLWSLNDHSPLTVLGEDTPGNVISVLSLKADHHMLLAAHEDGCLNAPRCSIMKSLAKRGLIWRNDVFMKSIQAHNGAVFAVGMEGKWLFTGGWDKSVNVQEISGDDLQIEAFPVGSIASDSTVTALLYWQGKLFVGCADRIIKV